MATTAQGRVAARAALLPLLKLRTELEQGTRDLRDAGWGNAADASLEGVTAIDDDLERFEALWVREPDKVAQRFLTHVVAALRQGTLPDQAAWAAVKAVQSDAALDDEMSKYPHLFPGRPTPPASTPYERSPAARGGPPELKGRDAEYVRLWAAGLVASQIAERFTVTTRSVEKHIVALRRLHGPNVVPYHRKR